MNEPETKVTYEIAFIHPSWMGHRTYSATIEEAREIRKKNAIHETRLTEVTTTVTRRVVE